MTDVAIDSHSSNDTPLNYTKKNSVHLVEEKLPDYVDENPIGFIEEPSSLFHDNFAVEDHQLKPPTTDQWATMKEAELEMLDWQSKLLLEDPDGTYEVSFLSKILQATDR